MGGGGREGEEGGGGEEGGLHEGPAPRVRIDVHHR